MLFGLIGDVALSSPLYSGVLNSGNWPAWLGVLAYLLLVFTPGAWISFGLPLRGISFWIRICMAVVLSPTIVCVEFYAIRLLGVSFESTALLLVLLNLPAIYLLWKGRGSLREVQRGDWLVGAIGIALSLATIGSALSNIDVRIYSGASWLHADAVYMLVRGDLVPEASTLAGLRMSYPVWSGLPFEAIHSYLVQAPPQSTYIWSDLFLLIAVCGLASGIAKELGGGLMARATAPLFLLLGTNPVGYFLAHFPPLHNLPQIWGDERYTPWVNKFMLFGPMTMGIAMTMAIIYLLVRPDAIRWEIYVVLGLLLCSIGLFYPLLFPSACGVVGARILADLTDKHWSHWKIYSREVLILAGLLVLACLLTYTEVRFLTAARHNSTGEVLLSAPHAAVRKLFAAVISTSLLLAGLTICCRRLLKVQRRATIVLSAGAAASYLLYVVFFVPFYENEYKFLFTAAMCLAVFPAIAIEQAWRKWPRAVAVPAVAVALLLPLSAYGDWAYRNWPAPWLGTHATSRSYQQTYDPPLNTDGFYIQLNKQDERFGICNAVRTMTPARSVLLVDDSAIYYPELTGRSLFVSAENRSYPGVNLWADALDVEVGGYGSEVLAERRRILKKLFESGDSSSREIALQSVEILKRPIAVIVDSAHADLLHWLESNKTARELYMENGRSLWLIDETGALE
jgi:hypothetical protein